VTFVQVLENVCHVFSNSHTGGQFNYKNLSTNFKLNITEVPFISIVHNTQHLYTDPSWCFRKALLAVLIADPPAASLVTPATVILCFQWALVFTGQMHTHKCTTALRFKSSGKLILCHWLDSYV